MQSKPFENTTCEYSLAWSVHYKTREVTNLKYQRQMLHVLFVNLTSSCPHGLVEYLSWHGSAENWNEELLNDRADV